jgi:hypothetical protein
MTKVAWFLNDRGEEIDRQEFLQEALEWHAGVLHIPFGNFTFPVAVLTCNAIGFHPLNISDCVEAFEEFCNATGREDWVAYDDEYDEDWTASGLASFESFEKFAARWPDAV